MTGLTDFLKDLKGSKIVGLLFGSGILVFLFFALAIILSLFKGGFFITLAVFMIISGCVSLIFFFIAIGMIYDEMN